MVLSDTNVASVLTRMEPDANVLRRMDRVARIRRFTTAITEAEIRCRLQMMPEGRRKTAIEKIDLHLFRRTFAGRILSLDSTASPHFPSILTGRLKQGRPMSFGDTQIAAIPSWIGAMFCTRNGKDSVDCGIPVCNPWAEDLEQRS